MFKAVLKNYIDVIVHQHDQRPKRYRLSKLFINIFLYILPFFLLLISLLLITIAIYFQDIKIYTQQQESLSLTQAKNRTKQLNTQLKEIKSENRALQKKLLAPIADSLAVSLGLFIPIPGQQDISGQGKSQIDNFSIERTPNILKFHFNINNLTGGKEKLSGYIFGIAKSKNALYVYPETALAKDQIHLAFNKGESFGTYRFRPSVIKFNIPNNINIDIFEIFIFSRTGDLLAKKIYSPALQGNQ